jgi:hypothetical protein
LNTLINRAKFAEENKKFAIAANHYFTIFSRYHTSLSSQEFSNILKNIIDSFVFNIVLLTPGLHRDKMLNFILKNENLRVFDYKPFLEKM